MLVVVGLLCALLLGLGVEGRATTRRSSCRAAGATVHVPDRHACRRGSPAIVLGLWSSSCSACGRSRAASRAGRPSGCSAVTALSLFVVAFLCWASTGQPGTTIDLVGLLQQTIFLATPLILGAMAGVLCERSGVINVAIEGQMLVGAFAGALFGTHGPQPRRRR